MEEIKNDTNVAAISMPTTTAQGEPKPITITVQPTQPVSAATQPNVAGSDNNFSLQTPPVTAPKEELGTSAPKKRAPRKPTEPKKNGFNRSDEKAKGDSEENKSIVSANQEPDEQINTSSQIEQQQQQRSDGDQLSRVREQPADKESGIDKRIREATTSNGARYVVNQGIFSRNDQARDAYQRIRERIEQRTGGWSRGRFR